MRLSSPCSSGKMTPRVLLNQYWSRFKELGCMGSADRVSSLREKESGWRMLGGGKTCQGDCKKKPR